MAGRVHASPASTLGLIALTLWLLAGCATVADTPAQDRAWERWRVCGPRFTTLVLNDVRPDGGIRFYYIGGVTVWAARECFRQAAEGQSRRLGVALPPEAEAVEWPRGGG